MAVTGRYLSWRALYTLNYASPVDTVVSVTLLAAELYGLAALLLFYLQVMAPPVRETAAYQEKTAPTVDVFIPICNEPSEILYRTLTGVSAMDYPRAKLNVYVLDDGRKDHIKKLAHSFGAHYYSREDNRHAKAGNMNFGMKHSKGEVLLLLDVDHVPVSSYLKETVGFFRDPKVAFVQTPHHFINPDSFQRNLHLEEELVHEQDLFFQVLQPARASANAVVFAGSSAVLRRSALDAIGGFRHESAIEDMHTGMNLQAHGYRGVFVNKILSAALSPETFGDYLSQRKRWTRGGVQMFILDNPLIKRGLSLRQRLNYFASLWYFFHAWPRLVYMVAPLSYLLFDCNPIVADTLTLLGYFLPHFIVSQLAFSMVTREYRSPFWSDVYEVASSFSLAWTALVTVFQPEKLKFEVTPKGLHQRTHEHFGMSDIAPHMALGVLLICGLVVATYSFMRTGLRPDAFGLSFFWTLVNLVYLGAAAEVARERPHRRSILRLRSGKACAIDTGDDMIPGTVVDLGEQGAAVSLQEKDDLPPLVKVRLESGSGEISVLEAEVLRNLWGRDGSSVVGLRFTDMTESQKQGVIRHMFCDPDSWSGVTRPHPHFWSAFRHLAGAPVRKRIRQISMVADRHPLPIALECVLETGAGRFTANTETIWNTGCVLRAKGAPAEGEARLLLPRRDGKPYAITVTVGKVKTKNGSDLHEAKFVRPTHLDLTHWKEEHAA